MYDFVGIFKFARLQASLFVHYGSNVLVEHRKQNVYVFVSMWVRACLCVCMNAINYID